MNRNMTQDMTKDTILQNIAKRLVRNGRTLVRIGAQPSSLGGALAQRFCLCANEITARARRDYGSCPTRLRLVVLMLLMMTVGSVNVWGQEPTGVQTVTEGVPYRIRTSMAEGVQLSTSTQTARSGNTDNSIKTVDYGAKDQIFYFESTSDKYFLKDASGNYFFVVSGNAYGTSRGAKVNTDKGKFGIEAVSSTDYVKLKCAGSGYLVVGRGFVSGSGVNGDGYKDRINDNSKSIILWKIIPWDPLQDFKVLIDAVAAYKDDNATLSSAYDTALALYESLNGTYGASEKADLIDNSTFITSVSGGISALTSARDNYLASLSSPDAGNYYVKNVRTGNLLTHSNDASAMLSSTIGESTLMTLEYADNFYYLKNGDKYMALKGTRANTPGTNYDMAGNVLSIEWKSTKDDNCKLNLKQFGNHRIGIQFNRYQTTNYTGGYLDFGPCTDFTKLYPLRESGISNPYSYWILIPETLQPPIITETDGVVEITSTDEDVTIWYTIDSEFNENNPTDGATEYTGLLDFSSPYTPRDIRAIAISNHIPTLISDVTLLQMPRDPISISANDQTIDINSVSTLSYTLSAGEGFVPYDKVYATSGNASIFTVDSEPFTGGSITLHPVGPGTATLTLIAKKTDGTTDACTTTVSITVGGTVNEPIISSVLADGAATITISSNAEGATIYYTDDGITTPTSGSTLYNAPFPIPVAQLPKTIKAIAIKGGVTSEVTTQVINAYTQSYVALHQNGAGYLKVKTANVTLDNDDTFRDKDIYSSDGYSIWVRTSDGYLQNGPYYLNVANGQTLYLSVTPVTTWSFTDVPGDTNGKQTVRYENKYLCRDDNTIKLSESATSGYRVCPITLTEKTDSWTGPTNSDVTVQSPQLVTYLRQYFSRKVSYNFVNDAGTTVSGNEKDNFVYALLEYNTSTDANKGSTWDIADGIIFNKQSSGNVTVTASYNLLPADLIARATHSTPVQKDIKLTIQPKSITLVAEMKYLLFSIKAGDNDRYPYDDGIAEDGDVKPDGKGGTGASSVLTDPDTPNLQISWKLAVDEEGFYTFQNASTNKYLYYDETPHASSDYGALKLGSSPSDNRYKFRLYKTSNTDYGTCYQIIPYSRQFAVYKNDGVATGFYASLNNNNYETQTPKVISLYKADDNSQWCIYTYEAEYRIRSDFSISGPNTASETGNYEFTSEGWYGKYIKESPKTGKGQNGLVINGTYKDANNIDYLWTVTGLGNNITIADGTNTDGTWKKTTRGNTNNRKLVVNVPSLPTSSTSGVIQLQLFSATNDNQKWSGFKTMAFTILGNGTVEWIDIASLASITNSSGAYRLTADATDAPGVTTFSGILDGGGHTISGLTAPLFETLTNGTVRNVNLSGVSISSHSGPTGAIAGTANGGSRIYNVGILDGSVGSSDDVCGGLVGQLDGSARVINCFSYATISGGTTVGGIVGENKYKTTAADARTMVMNCMFYGNITGGTNKAPIYNGEIISNVGETGVGNYNYFLADATFTDGIDTYNCALMAEKRFLQRFEFFRHLLNGHRELAGWWATGTFSKTEMAKWVMEPSQLGTSTPYPILKAQGKYPSVVNIDAENATTQSERNKGGKLGELTVNIQMGDGEVYNRPSGAAITTPQLTLNITDKDPDHFNFNYYKVQLPYYNDVGTKNYTGNRVVTGWKIVSITGGSAGSFTTDEDVTYNESGEIATMPYNFADRNCTNKDLYGTNGSNRVFNQGAYWDVPEGVTAITIEPYWAKCVYLADDNADVVYNTNMGTAYPVPNVGGGKIYNNGTSYSIAGENQVVYTTMSNAISSTNSTGLFVGIEGDANNQTVYDYAVVLVGNYHNYNSIESSNSKPYTVTSIDLDGDNEPDYSYILRFDARKGVHPVKYDFLNLIGLGMAQKSTGSTGSYNFGIMQPMNWFEVTNTALFRVTQLEYEHKDRAAKPLILHGGVIEQWVSGQSGGNGQQTTYIHVGSNVWFKEFHLGCHQDATLVTKHPPVSVTGGDYNEFYLTGLYSAAANCEDNAECYINGGRFDKVAGTGIEGIGKANGAENTGNIVWQIQNADIEEFYGGGINAAKPMQGNITTVITGSHVKRFCGGPKFGDMNTGKTVITTATNCTFGSFFGAGYGGNSYNRAAPGNFTGSANYRWNDWIAGTVKGSINSGNYPNGVTYSGYKQDYISQFGGVSTRFDYQFLPQSDNTNNVGRLFIDFVNFSLATTHNVTSTLTGCTITGNFYGGGSLGKVDGNVTSTLTNCTVRGSVFGGGYDATRPTVQVMSTAGFTTPPDYNTNTGVFIPAAEPYNSSEEYSWEHSETVNSTATAINKDDHILYTTADLTTLGQVTGNVTLDITGNTLVEGQAVDYEGNPTSGDRGGVFGGGDASAVLGNTTVTINATALQEGAAYNAYRVYGGGNSAPVGGNSIVTLKGKTQVLDNVFGGGNEGEVGGNATVNIQQ